MSALHPEIDEKEYKGDLELLDRYVSFSAEIVRVSLLGLAAIGFYLKEFVAPPASSTPAGIAATWFFTLLGSAGFMLAVAVGCGLLHRYYATDGLASHLKALRLSADSDPLEQAKAPAEAAQSTSRYRLSRGWLVSAECAAASGVAILGVAFGVRLGVFGSLPRWKIAVPAAFAIVVAASIVAATTWLKFFRRKRAPDSVGPASQVPTEAGLKQS